MTTVEKLLVQIFERKNWIIEQAKHQAELYNQHLASKLVIDGIPPPSWLWSPNNSAGPKEINKEDLISKFLNPHPQPPAYCSKAHYPLHINQVGIGDNIEFSDGFFMGTLTSNKGLNRQNHVTVLAGSDEDEAGYTSKNVSELDLSITSPVDQTDERILNIHNAPDQSLAKIQRSRSRQKALELRSGAKSLTKIGLNHRNINDNFRLSILFTEQEGRRDDLPELTEHCRITEGCKKRDFGESDCQTKEMGLDVYTGRITRSRSCAKAPYFIGGSEGLGCEPGNRRKDVSSVSGINSNYVNNLQHSCPSAASFQTCALRSLDGADCRGEDIENNVCSEDITWSEFSCRGAGDYSKVNCSYDNAQINHDPIMDFDDRLPETCAHGSLVTFSGANVLDERGDDRQSIAEDCKNEKEMTVVPRSSQHISGLDANPHQDTSSHFNGADSGPLPSTSERLALVPNAPRKEPGLAEPSLGTVDIVTRSKSDLEKKSVANDELMNAQQGADNAMGSELVLCKLVDQSVSFSPIDTKQRGGLESLVAESSQNSSLFVEPANMLEDYNLKISTSCPQMKQLNNMSEKMDCSFSDPAASIDKGIPGNMNQVSIDEESTERLGVCSKEGEAWTDSFDSNVWKNLEARTEKYVASVGEHKMSKISQDDTMAGLNCEISEVRDVINIMQSEVNDSPDVHSHPVKHYDDLLPVQHTDEGNWRKKGKDKVSLVSNAPVSNACRRSNFVDLIKMPNAESHVGLAEKWEMTKDYQVLPYLEVEVSGQRADLPLGEIGLMIPNSDGSPAFDSWPQLKRRKIKHHDTNRHTALPCVGVKKLHSIQMGPSSPYMANTEKDVMSTDMGANELRGYNLAELECTFESRNGEDQFCSKEKDKHKSSSTTSELSEIALVEGMRTESRIHYLDASDPDDKERNQYSSSITDNTSDENLTLNQSTIPSECKEGIQSQPLVLSPRNNLEFNAVDQSLPVFEGFMVDAQSYSGELDFPAHEVDFEKLKSPRNVIERASILAKICKSASTDTPLSDFSSALEHVSRLESLDMNTLPLNGDVDKPLEFGNSLVNNVKDSFERMPYSDCLPHYGARYGWNSRNLSASPVGKLWERLSLQSGSSSEKCTSTNPDLTCFRIEEDPCVSEENETMDAISDNVQNDIDSLQANTCDRRQPLKEMTNLGLVPPVSTEPISVSLSAKPIVSVKKDTAEQSLKKQTSGLGNNEISEKQTFSVGVNGIKKAKESINNSVRKPVLRSKSSLKREEQKLSLKESRKNNIVSHVNSFVPLVQQKQAAPICAGKREVKVKALEAAEAAKRIEEKREKERRIKKEALKHERAKLEENNLREMELKKKKEAERKKKEDDVLTKKRLREDEERKEEKKRMRFESRQRQREQEEKLRMRAKKAEKLKDHPKGGRMNSKMEVTESKNPHTRGIMRGNDSVLKDTETRWAPTELAMHTVVKSPTSGILMAQKCQGKSYEISPYQCSDDEDEEEEDELPTKKSIPSWASKISVALLLPLQQGIEPDAIFPRDSFCCMDEVLLPRNVK